MVPVLAADKYKNIIADSLRLMVKENRVELIAFIVMDIIFHMDCFTKTGMEHFNMLTHYRGK